ncbi:hypothetical protein [Acidaminococcus timonensis]|jgi:hypothetical protein|uniref:hypothetical protein n=1 Tax=Acidaminococcus timonensis TaxID=1871002 RepID=UPI00248B0DEF|nr:hypothetical protein [Acidaminococcus timonensis]
MRETFKDSVADMVTKVDKDEFLRTRMVAWMDLWDNPQKQETGKRCCCRKNRK